MKRILPTALPTLDNLLPILVCNWFAGSLQLVCRFLAIGLQLVCTKMRALDIRANQFPAYLAG
jgi:hypothetical protein